MKKAFLALLPALALAFLCACAANGAGDSPTPAGLHSEWEVVDGITIRLLQDDYPEGTERMTLVMENRSDRVMLYGNGWSFERYEDGEWKPLPNREDAGFTMEGYTLYEYRKDTFHVSAFALAEPLTEGTYRVTGCTLRVAVHYGGVYEALPAYRLEFTVSKDAPPEPEQPEETAPPGGLAPKESWEWYTAWEGLALFEGQGRHVWEIQADGHGLAAFLCRPGGPDGDVLNEGDLLTLHLFDRKTGEICTVFDVPTVEIGAVTPLPDGGFSVSAPEGEYTLKKDDGEWSVSGPDGAGA